MKIPQRHEVDPKYQWATTDLFPSDEAWEEAYAKAEAMIPGIAAYAGKLNTAKGLYDYLTAKDEGNALIRRVSQYASLRTDEDSRVSKYQDYSARVGRLGTKVSAAIAHTVYLLLGKRVYGINAH